MDRNITRLDERTTRQIFSAGETAFFNVQFNGGITSSDGQTTEFGYGGRINFMINFKRFHKYSNIKSIKLMIKPIGSAEGIAYNLNEEQSLSSDYRNSYGTYIGGKSEYIEVEVLNLCDSSQLSTEYFSVYFLGNAKIYTKSAYSAGYRPKIIVEYIDDKESIINQKVLQGSAGRALEYSVNVRSGRPTYTKSLLSMNTAILPIHVAICYDPLNPTSMIGNMPKGWRFNYSQKINANTEGYEYIDAKGLLHQFVTAYNDNSIYCDIAGTGLVLTKETTRYKMEDGYNNYLYFNLAGWLTKVSKKIYDELGNPNEFITQIRYIDETANITSIEEIEIISGVENIIHKVTINYNTSSENNIIVTSIGFPNTTITKDSNGNLESITEEDLRVSTYTYNANNVLFTAQTDNGEKVIFTYDSKDRIRTITSCVKVDENITDKLIFNYGYSATYITDFYGINRGYSFNTEGELLGEYEYSDIEYKDISYINKAYEYTKIDLSSKESYLAYGDKTLNGRLSLEVSEILHENINLSRGDLQLTTSDTFALSFIYNFTSAIAVGERINSYVAVMQGSTQLCVKRLSQFQMSEAVASISFTCNNTSAITIKIGHNYNRGEMHVKNIRVHQAVEVQTNLCVSNYVGNRAYYTIGSESFWIFTHRGFKYGDLQHELNKTMYQEDLQENLKNIAYNTTNHHIWYNKKRGLVANTSNIRLTTNVGEATLGELKMCIVSEFEGKTAFNYSDYAANQGINNYLRTDYNKIKNNQNNNTYKVLSQQIINRNYQIVKEYDSNRLQSVYSFDKYANVLSRKVINEHDSKYIAEESTFDHKRKISETTYVNGNASTITYETNQDTGSIEKVAYPDNSAVDYTYYDNTNAKLKELSTNVNGIINTNAFNYGKDLISTYKGMSSGLSLSYDKYNLPFRFNNGSNYIWTKNTSIVNTGDIEIIHYDTVGSYYLKNRFDVYGRLVEDLESKNGSSYTSLNKLFYSDLSADSITESEVSTTSVSKSHKSKLRKKIDGILGNETKWYYDNRGNVSKITNTNTTYKMNVELYEYDENFRFSSKISNYGLRIESVNYADDFTKEVSGYYAKLARYPLESRVDYTKDNLGRKIREDITTTGSDNLSRVFSYLDNENNCSLLVKLVLFFYNTTIYDMLNYEYDLLGRITKIYNTSQSILNIYKYDCLGRLIREDNKGLNKTIIMTYDLNGNILSKKIGSYTTGNLTNYVIKSYEIGTSSWSDTIVKYNGLAVNMTNTGNITKIGDTSYSWIREKYISQVKLTSSNYVNMSYDASGVRYYKQHYYNSNIITHRYVTDEGRILSEDITGGEYAGTLDYIYLGNEVVGFVYRNNKYFYQKNLQGDIVRIFDEINTLISEYEYDAWGNHIIKLDKNSIGTINPFRYRGYYYDSETNLYYCQERYYNPELCRWMSLDDIGYVEPSRINGFNLYAYCGNNPVMYNDRTGHFPVLAILGLILASGAIIHAATLTLGYVRNAIASIWDEDIRADMNRIGWNPFNSDENLVLKSNKVSFYKGSFVLRHSIPNATSAGVLGMIFLNSNETDSITVKHEWGHNMQELILGTPIYLLSVAAPSLIYNMTGNYTNYSEPVSSRMYYSKIWERTADWLGGINRKNYDPFWKWSNFIPW